jgi:truncated hemoglobin YjbI
VERDPLLRPLFPGKTFTCAIEAFAAFLVQFLGGPSEHTERRWWLSLRESHQRFQIGQKERDAWIDCMIAALDDVQIAEPWRSHLLGFFEQSSAYIVNREAHCRGTHAEISRRWRAQVLLDEVVAAIHRGDAHGAIALAEDSALEICSPSVITGLLTVMLRSGKRELLDYVAARLVSDPTLAQERYAGRTLLHEAAGAGNPAIVELLLRLGVDPNARDSGGHTPLYCLANECAVEGAGKVVRALVQGGAEVDASGGVQRCSPLHMAARRGNVEVAGALLDCGANIEARDKVGDTALRRSVNCEKAGVAALLVARGADVNAVGSKGITPRLAAKSSAMKRALAG